MLDIDVLLHIPDDDRLVTDRLGSTSSASSERPLALAHARLPVQQDLVAREEAVHLFERQVARLRVEEPDQRDERRVEDREVDVCSPRDALYRDLLGSGRVLASAVCEAVVRIYR